MSAAVASASAAGSTEPELFDIAEDEACSEVQRWLADLGLGRYSGLLQAEGFDDFRIIRGATEDDLTELVALCGMPRMHAKQLRRAISNLQESAASSQKCRDEMEDEGTDIWEVERLERPASSEVDQPGDQPRDQPCADDGQGGSPASSADPCLQSSTGSTSLQRLDRDTVANFAHLDNTDTLASLASSREGTALDSLAHDNGEASCCQEFFAQSPPEVLQNDNKDADEPADIITSAGQTSAERKFSHVSTAITEWRTWEVVGGKHAGGVLVRSGQDLKSPETVPPRLSCGALVREITLLGARLKFELVDGDGPAGGWVSIKCSGKDLLVQRSGPEVESPQTTAVAGLTEAQLADHEEVPLAGDEELLEGVDAQSPASSTEVVFPVTESQHDDSEDDDLPELEDACPPSPGAQEEQVAPTSHDVASSPPQSCAPPQNTGAFTETASIASEASSASSSDAFRLEVREPKKAGSFSKPLKNLTPLKPQFVLSNPNANKEGGPYKIGQPKSAAPRRGIFHAFDSMAGRAASNTVTNLNGNALPSLNNLLLRPPNSGKPIVSEVARNVALLETRPLAPQKML